MDRNSDRKDIEPLALLVHPQQPLSYLERLIQSELPTIKTKEGADKIPSVAFRAQQAGEDEIRPRTKPTDDEDIEETSSDKEADNSRLGDGGVASYSGAGRESSSEDKDQAFVRWSSSTEIGDFIRDAARAKEFEIEIEGASDIIKVAVPSFNDRTYYLRMRLRKTSGKIKDMAVVKKECDMLAHKAGQRVAVAGLFVMMGWWCLVYRLTFQTDLGWDTVEPVTYLVGLSTLMGGYLWFLYHNREVSYRSALNLTISRRQNKLYQQKGFDIQRWEALIEEGNALRREIKAVASEYDVDWDEREDEQDKEVTKALKKDRDDNKKDSDKKSKSKTKDDDEDDE
jgi:calcium uniporter protein, mitochondrial